MSKTVRAQMSILAKVGINALVDEATGYQTHRASNALSAMLEQYVVDDLLNLKAGLSDTYYKEVCRLHGFTLGQETDAGIDAMVAFAGKYLYGFLSSAIGDQELSDAGAMRQRLGSAGVSDAQLINHVVQLETVMQISSDMSDFDRNFNKIFIVNK